MHGLTCACRLAATLALILLPARLPAQCADGTPSPCRAAAPAALRRLSYFTFATGLVPLRLEADRLRADIAARTRP